MRTSPYVPTFQNAYKFKIHWWSNGSCTDLRLLGRYLGVDERTPSTAQPGKDWASCLPCHSNSTAWLHHPATITPSASVRNLGVIFDDQLTFKEHTAKTARSCRFALHNIRKIRPFLTEHAAQLLVQALVISRLDYCSHWYTASRYHHRECVCVCVCACEREFVFCVWVCVWESVFCALRAEHELHEALLSRVSVTWQSSSHTRGVCVCVRERFLRLLLLKMSEERDPAAQTEGDEDLFVSAMEVRRSTLSPTPPPRRTDTAFCSHTRITNQYS